MGLNIFEKIIKDHLVEGKMEKGKEMGIRVDQTLTQDALAPMVCRQFESLGVSRIKTEISVSYVDHLISQYGPANAEVHKYLETVSDKLGIIYSKPGNGICHLLHLDRFSKPGKVLIGSDSHTVTCGAVGMLAMGVGGLDVAVAMAGYPLYFKFPNVIRINLVGKLRDWVSAKDIALEVVRILKTKGNVGNVIEYGGRGLKNLSVGERATIANMGAETGVTASLFPSDEITRDFFKQEDRLGDWTYLDADEGANYDRVLNIDLSKLEPLVALPHSPDNVKRVSDIEDLCVDQILIGSCTNASFKDLMKVARILKGKKIKSSVSLGVVPGTRQVLNLLSQNGALSDLISAGARIFEPGCGFCIGQGQSPRKNGISIRTNNRNYIGRSGTQSAQVYLVSPETAAYTALNGKLSSPFGGDLEYVEEDLPKNVIINDNMFIYPKGEAESYESDLIGRPPINKGLPDNLICELAIKLGDNITTDDIIPAGSAMDFRNNIKRSTEIIFSNIDKNFPQRCLEIRDRQMYPMIVAGESYGQGSSREHAAMCPMAMGVKIVIGKSIERIHRSNLINFGILPLTFLNDDDYNYLEKGDKLTIDNLIDQLCKEEIILINQTREKIISLKNNLSKREVEIIVKGGLVNYIKARN